jgi:asparagine synthase (glutamine-hydrolysing)
VGLAQRRLSIIDLSSDGHQPFFSADRNLVMVYNGEVYNYKELRTELEHKGIQFSTKTDTEVVMAWYQYAGIKAFDKFNGMFSIAIWDIQKQEMLVLRDRVGVKPFYYSINENGFYFASEPKALIKYGVDATLNESGFDELLAFRFISGENTIFKHIKRLLPGHFATINIDGKMDIKRWWNLGEKIQSHPTIKNPFEWFSNTFNSSINYRMVSDVKVGVLLSAGLDSTSVARVIKNNRYENIENFNVGFRQSAHDESMLAEKYCDELEYSFNKIYVEKESLSGYVQDASYFLDEPLVHLNDPHILAISKFAKSKVSVLLSGEGADEFMGGYLRYKTFQHQDFWPLLKAGVKLSNSFLKNPRLRKLGEYLSMNNLDMKILMNGSNVFMSEWIKKYQLEGMNFLPEYRLDILKEAKNIYPDNPLRQLLYLDQHTYLQSLNDRNDRATMGASIECREPFMDYRLMEGIGTLPDNFLFKGKKNKFLLANTVGKTLPDYIRKFKKMGFSSPWEVYIKTDEFFRHHLFNLEKSDIFKTGIFNKIDIGKCRSEFLEFNQHKALIIQLVFISIWYDGYFRRINEN